MLISIVIHQNRYKCYQEGRRQSCPAIRTNRVGLNKSHWTLDMSANLLFTALPMRITQTPKENNVENVEKSH